MDAFDDRYIQVLGASVSKKSMRPQVDGETISLDLALWDIRGQKASEMIKEAYFYGAKGIIAVCDVTRRSTLDDLDDWIEGVYSVTGKVPIQFLANKWDLRDRAEFAETEIHQATRAYDSPFSFTSAKTGENVEAGFQSLAERVAKERLAKAPVEE